MIWINLLRFRASVRTRSGADALGDGYPGGTDPIGVLTGVPAARGSDSFLTRRWRKPDSNSRSHPLTRGQTDGSDPPHLPTQQIYRSRFQNRMQQELHLNLARVAEDRTRLRIDKILHATDRNVRRLCGTPHHPGSRAELLDQRLTDRGLSSPEEAEDGRGPPTEMP
jgi:hypothetical protein